MNLKAAYFVEAAADAIKEEILNQIANQQHRQSVPCEPGAREFNKLVKTYWQLCEMIGKKDEVMPMPQMECAEAMCEVARD